jgi:hypothetical protein
MRSRFCWLPAAFKLGIFCPLGVAGHSEPYAISRFVNLPQVMLGYLEGWIALGSSR